MHECYKLVCLLEPGSKRTKQMKWKAYFDVCLCRMHIGKAAR